MTSQTPTIEFWYNIPSPANVEQVLETFQQSVSQVQSIEELNTSLLLVPSYQLQHHFLQQLAQRADQAILSTQVMTFDAFARKILVESQVPLKSLTGPHKRLLLRELIEQAVENKAWHKLAPIAETDGMVDLVDRFLVEMKREEIWPETLAEWLEDQPGRQTERELEKLYSQYQQQLHERHLYDAEGLFWLARAELTGNPQLLKRQKLVMVAGFADFTWPQREMLRVISQRAERTILTLPHQPQEHRTSLFHTSLVSEKRLQPLCKLHQRVNWTAPSPHDHSAAQGLVHVRQSLFASMDDHTPALESNNTGVRMIAAMGQRSEARMIAREIRNAFNQGLSPDQVAIGLRQADDFHTELLQTLSDAGIPVVSEFTRPLRNCELVSALERILQVELSHWSFRSLKALLRNRLFQSFLELEDPTQSIDPQIDQLFQVLRAYDHRKGRAGILKQLHNRLEKLSTEDPLEQAESEEESNRLTSSQIATALQLLKRLDAILQRLRSRWSMQEWVEQLLIVLNEFSWDQQLEKQHQHAPQLQLLSQWEQIKNSLASSAQWQNELSGGKTFTLQQFHQWFTQVLRLRQLEKNTPTGGAVRILPVEQLRHLPASLLFLPGLTEDSFPQPGVNETLLTDEDRQALAHAVRQQAPPLRSLQESYCDELLLFHQLICQAQSQIILSYPETNDRGHPAYPSPFLHAVMELFDSQSSLLEHEGDLSPLPASDDIVTKADWRRIGTRMAMQGNAENLQSYLSHFPKTFPFWQSSLESLQARWFTKGWTAYEGMLNHPQTKQAIQERYSVTRPLSATLLEKYAQCPFRMMIELGLRMSPLQDPQLQTDYRRRGIVLHQLMNDMHLEGAQREKGLHAEEIKERFLEQVNQQFSQHVSSSEIVAALNEIEHRLFNEWAERYGNQHSQYTQQFENWNKAAQPEYMELTFGKQESHPPLKLEHEQQQVFIEGRIDRVDVGEAEDGTKRFSIIDYKTGNTPKFNDRQLQQGTSLQLMLYTLAVLRLELVGKQAVPHQLGYWKIKKEGFEFGYSNRKRQTQLTDELLTQLTEMLEPAVVKLAEHLRQAMFPVTSTDENCTQNCPYKTGCRVYEIRYVQEKLEKHWAPTQANSAEAEEDDGAAPSREISTKNAH